MRVQGWLELTSQSSYMWHEQGEWVICWEYWFWVIGWKKWWILNVWHCSGTSKNCSIPATRCPTEMGFKSESCILNGQVLYIEKSKLNVEDMWPIPLDFVIQCFRRKIILSQTPKYKNWVKVGKKMIYCMRWNYKQYPLHLCVKQTKEVIHVVFHIWYLIHLLNDSV